MILAAAAAGLAVTLLFAAPPRRAPRLAAPTVARDDSWLRRHRLVVVGLAGLGAATVIGGATGLVLAPPAAVGAWVVITRAEPPGARRRAEVIRRDLPAIVTLLGAALRSGAAPGEALDVVSLALPGPGADRLSAVASRLRLGDDPAAAWADLAHDPELAALGRTLARAHLTGTSVVRAVERLADDLARSARAAVEDRARAVGVKAAVPLGLCLLPAFVLIGIVPLVAGLVGSLEL